MFADEPTGALDSLAAEGLLELLVSLAEGSGVTLLIVTHDRRVAAYAQREVVVGVTVGRRRAQLAPPARMAERKTVLSGIVVG